MSVIPIFCPRKDAIAQDKCHSDRCGAVDDVVDCEKSEKDKAMVNSLLNLVLWVGQSLD